MATKTRRKSRRYGLTLTLNRELYEAYVTSQTRAGEPVVEFGDDFVQWFENKLRKSICEFEKHAARGEQQHMEEVQ